MGVIEGESPIPETYFGPLEAKPWWDVEDSQAATVFTDRDITSEEALVAAGLDWTVEARPLFYGGDATYAQPGQVLLSPKAADRWQANVRASDGAYLGIRMPGYRIFQNAEMAEMGDYLLGLGGSYCHTGGSLYGGKIVWLLYKFDKAIHVKGDDSPIEDYLAITNGHDGRHGCTAMTTAVRILCGNTCQQALEGAKDKVTLRHTSGMERRFEQVRAALDLHVQYRESLESVLNALADRPMTIDAVRRFTVALIPANPDVEKPVRTEAKRDLIADLFAKSPTLVGVAPTAYRAYQAVVEAADQYTPYRDTKLQKGADRRAMAVMEGTAYDLKSDAVRLLLKA